MYLAQHHDNNTFNHITTNLSFCSMDSCSFARAKLLYSGREIYDRITDKYLHFRHDKLDTYPK